MLYSSILFKTSRKAFFQNDQQKTWINLLTINCTKNNDNNVSEFDRIFKFSLAQSVVNRHFPWRGSTYLTAWLFPWGGSLMHFVLNTNGYKILQWVMR